jgi:hypothetical protein
LRPSGGSRTVAAEASARSGTITVRITLAA